MLRPTVPVAPYDAIAAVDGLDGRGVPDSEVCSGTYVGPWTFVTGGRCLRMPDATPNPDKNLAEILGLAGRPAVSAIAIR